MFRQSATVLESSPVPCEMGACHALSPIDIDVATEGAARLSLGPPSPDEQSGLLVALEQGLAQVERVAQEYLRPDGRHGDLAAFADLPACLCNEGRAAARSAHASSEAGPLAMLVTGDLPANFEALPGEERASLVLCKLQRIMKRLGGGIAAVADNRFESDFARWAANGANVALRTGLIVAITTTLRQLIGFAAERAMTTGELSAETRQAIGLSCLLVGPGLNLLGMARDEVQGRATPWSRAGRGAMVAVSLGTTAWLMSTPPSMTLLGTPMSGLGLQMLSYCAAREVAQLFFPQPDNAGLNLPGIGLSAGAYGVAQWLFSDAMDQLSPSSGAGLVMAAAGRASAASGATPESVRAAVASLQPQLTHDLIRGGLNAAAECVDGLVSPVLRRAVDVHRLRQGRAAAGLPTQDAEGGDTAPPTRAETEGARIRTTVRWPDRQAFGDMALLGLAQRTTAFESIMAAAIATSAVAAEAGLTASTQTRITNAVVGGMCALIYAPFFLAYDRRPAAGRAMESPEVASATSRDAAPATSRDTSRDASPTTSSGRTTLRSRRSDLGLGTVV